MRLSLFLLSALALLLWAGWSLTADWPAAPRWLAIVAWLPLLALMLTVFGGLLAGGLDRSGQRSRGLARVRLWVGEALAFGWCFLIAQPFLAWFMPTRDRVAAGQRGQLLLVHGFACNRGLWWLWREAFRRAGWRTAVIDLPPSWWRIETQLSHLRAEVERLQSEAPDLPLWLIGHSMGGVAARWLQARAEGKPPGVICLGAPHHGTLLAGSVGGPHYGPPLPSSPWLIEFNRQAAALPAGSLNLWSVDEAIVVPADSSRLDTQRDLVISGLGHMGLCQASSVARIVLKHLHG